MMNKFALFLLPVFMISCTVIKQINQEEIVARFDNATLEYNDKVPLLSLEIDNTKTKFLFDTGATASCLTDSSVVNLAGKDFGILFPAIGADGKKVKMKKITVAIHSDLFDSKNKILSYIPMPASACSNTVKRFSGILGLDVFFEKKLSMQMDFSNGIVRNINSDQIKSLLEKNNYKEVKSAFKINQLLIFLTIEGKEYRCLLDTGFSGCISVPANKKVISNSAQKIELEGSLYQTISSFTQGKEILYEKVPLSFGRNNFDARVNVSNTITAQNVGIDFIKGFDWIVDYHNKKIYVRRNQNKIESAFQRRVSYLAKVIDDRLLITIKEKSQSKYHLGDKIISVNNQKVTAENNCAMQDLLNKTDDWNTLQLEVVSK